MYLHSEIVGGKTVQFKEMEAQLQAIKKAKKIKTVGVKAKRRNKGEGKVELEKLYRIMKTRYLSKSARVLVIICK